MADNGHIISGILPIPFRRAPKLQAPPAKRSNYYIRGFTEPNWTTGWRIDALSLFETTKMA